MANGKWGVWVHQDLYVMIRNHKTSRCLVKMDTAELAQQQARKLMTYPWQRLHELYLTAVACDILTLKHEHLGFKATSLKPIEIKRGRECYAILVWVDGKQVIAAKKKYKKDCEELLKTWRLEMTDWEIVQAVKLKLQQRGATQK